MMDAKFSCERWSFSEVMELLGLLDTFVAEEKFDGTVRDAEIYKTIAEELCNAGYSRTQAQVRNKIKCLRQRYKEAKDQRKKGEGHHFRYFDLMELIYRDRSADAPSETDSPEVEDCKRRWKAINETYKKRQREKIEDSGNKKKKLQPDDSLVTGKEQNPSSIQSGENRSQEATSQLLSTSNDSQSGKDTQIGQTSRVGILLPPPTPSSQSTGVEDILISLGQISRGSILPSQLPKTSKTKDSQQNNVEDVPFSLRQTSRGGIMLSSTKDSKQTKVGDVPMFSRQASRGSKEASQLHPDPPTNGQSHGVEDVRTVRQPNKKPRLNGDILESLWGTERDILLKLIAEERREDDVDLFFKSIAASVKKLRPDLIHEAKMRCLQMIFDLENRASISSDEKRFNFAPEPSRSPSPNSILSSPSSVENNITIKTEIDES